GAAATRRNRCPACSRRRRRHRRAAATRRRRGERATRVRGVAARDAVVTVALVAVVAVTGGIGVLAMRVLVVGPADTARARATVGLTAAVAVDRRRAVARRVVR